MGPDFLLKTEKMVSQLLKWSQMVSQKCIHVKSFMVYQLLVDNINTNLTGVKVVLNQNISHPWKVG